MKTILPKYKDLEVPFSTLNKVKGDGKELSLPIPARSIVTLTNGLLHHIIRTLLSRQNQLWSTGAGNKEEAIMSYLSASINVFYSHFAADGPHGQDREESGKQFNDHL